MNAMTPRKVKIPQNRCVKTLSSFSDPVNSFFGTHRKTFPKTASILW